MAIYFPLGDSSLINHQRTFVFLVEVGEEEDEMKHEASKEHEQANPTTKKMPVWTWSCVTRLGGTSVVWETRREEGHAYLIFCFFSFHWWWSRGEKIWRTREPVEMRVFLQDFYK